jgi:alkylated DNA repair dioxygenase AlkB
MEKEDVKKDYSDYFVYFANFLEKNGFDSNKLFKDIVREICNDGGWEEGTVVLFGKKFKEPRLSAWFADNTSLSYTYSGRKTNVRPWTPSLLKLKDFLNDKFGISLNSALCNYYRDGDDYIGFHSDSDRGIDPAHILSISLGEERRFVIKRKDTGEIVFKQELSLGSLLYMKGEKGNNCQDLFKHSLPRQMNKNSRLNITFRIATPKITKEIPRYISTNITPEMRKEIPLSALEDEEIETANECANLLEKAEKNAKKFAKSEMSKISYKK